VFVLAAPAPIQHCVHACVRVCSLTRCSCPQLICFYYVLTTFTTVGYGVCVSARARACVRVRERVRACVCMSSSTVSIVLYCGLSSSRAQVGFRILQVHWHMLHVYDMLQLHLQCK
jgi:hypothetical protein